jgi:hypothetical protein
MRSQPYFFVVFLFFLACAEPKQDAQIAEIEKLDSAIMQVHDAVMPKIAKVLSLRKQLQNKIDSGLVSAQKEQFEAATYALTKADAAMMQWMRNYQIPLKSDTAIIYLQQQVLEMNEISEAIYQSIRVADSTLNSLKP